MNSRYCIFCQSILNATTKPEHIIPNSIGGRVTSRTIVCSDCNHEMGKQIDEPFADDFKVIRNQLNIKTGSGQPPPTLRKVATNQGMVDILPGGVPQTSSPLIEPAQNGKGFAIKSHPDRWFELLLHQLYRHGYRPGDDIQRWNLAANSERFFVDGDDGFVISFGSLEHLRAIAKMAFESFAIRWCVEAHDPRLDQVRTFVRHGGQSSCVMWDYENRPSLPFQSVELGPAYHSVFVWSMGPGEPLAAAVTLFGGYCWTVELAKEWWENPFAYAHAVNPLTESIVGNHRVVETIPGPRLDPNWANKRQPAVEAVRNHSANLFTLWYEMQKDKHLRSMIHRVVNQVMEREGWTDGEPWRDEMGFMLADPFATEYVRFKTRSPHMEPLNTDHLCQRIEAEYPVFFANKNLKS